MTALPAPTSGPAAEMRAHYIETDVLHVPATCAAGHQLTARTTHIRKSLGPLTNSATGRPMSWECVICLRVGCFRAYYGNSVDVPAELLRPEHYGRQQRTDRRSERRDGEWPRVEGSWWTRVEFASGWGFCDPDPPVGAVASESAM